jgi:hypothetical protein
MNGLGSMIVLNIVAFFMLHSILLEVHRVCLKSAVTLTFKFYTQHSFEIYMSIVQAFIGNNFFFFCLHDYIVKLDTF